MKLLVDNNLPPRLGRGLGTLFDGIHQVLHIREKFGTGSLPDEEWIKALGSEGGWCVLSGDRRIATKRPSRELFLRNGLIGFFPQPSVMKLSLEKKAARILNHWEKMVVQSETVSSGCFEIGMRGERLRAF